MAGPRDDGPEDGRKIGRWTLRRLLGQGGQGQVWKVYENTPSGQPRWGVMKLPLASGVGNEREIRRMASEVRVGMKLQGCPNVVNVIDMGVDDGIFYFVMEYVHGTDLAEFARLLRRGRVRPAVAEVAWIAGEILTCLKSIHNQVIGGIPQELCHLDITMKNIFVSVKGEVKIGDFGIARGALDPSLTNRGTPRYMAPEHYIGFPNQKSDVFALGIVLWELLERESYRKGEDINEIGIEITNHTVRPMRRTDVSPEFARLIYDCLDPLDHRRPSASEALARLEKLPEYRMQRSRIAELMAHHWAGAGNSGQTELMDALPASVTPELAGMRAAGRVLAEQGNALGLQEVFAGLPKPGRAPGHVAVPPPREDDDAPLPPAMFAGDDGEDDTEAPRQAAPRLARASPEGVAPSIAAAPAGSAPDRARTVPLEGLDHRAPDVATRKFTNDEQASVMGPPPAGPLLARAPVGDDRRPSPAAAPIPVEAPGDANTPWPQRRETLPPTGPERASTTEPVRASESTISIAAPSRARQGLVLGLAAAAALAGGGGVATWLVGSSGEDDASRPAARIERDTPNRSDHAAARTSTPSSEAEGPRLVAVHAPAVAPTPTATPSPTPDADEPSPPSAALGPAATATVVAPTPTPTVAPESPLVDRPATSPASVRPAGPAPAAEPAAVPPEPKPKPKLGPPVKVEVRVEFVAGGADVKVGGKKVTTNASAFFEIPSGRHPVQWRQSGTPKYKKAGAFVLAADASHVILVGKVGTPSGVRHVAQKLAKPPHKPGEPK